MPIWNERIHEKRIEKGITLAQVADRLGVTEATAQRYERGNIKSIPYEHMCAYGEILNCSPAYLMGWENNSSVAVNNAFPIELKSFPLLGEIACGIPTYTNEDRESYIMAGTNIHADFCLKAKGDSMINARIHEGDIVFIRKQDIVDNGEIAAVVVNNENEATLKRFYYYAEKSMVILKAENTAYEDLIFTNDELNDFHVLGKAVAFQSDVI
ncbi:LexA family protein [Parablautia intestinalis]|uniref:LexA family protein n=1 Tax=Parablautia intestinalis TaxID=2320100 RepID=UPI00256F2279|nr:S24 family peptidase [Parablautia intestinalis]